MSGIGRPPSSRPKSIEAKARITEDENKMLGFCCEETGLSRSEVIRAGIKKVYDETIKKKYPKRT